MPTQPVVAFRFNLDQLFVNSAADPLGGTGLNRYTLNNTVANTALQIQSIPGPVGNTFDDWIAVFDLGGLSDFNDDADGDGIPNGIEAWFGTFPDEFSAGLAVAGTNGLTTTFSHPQNQNPLVGLTASYEWSPDLVGWYADGDGPDGGPVVGFLAETEAGFTTVTATASSALPRIFLRVRVAQE